MSQQQPDPEPPIAHHTVETPPDEALKYWTDKKKRKAKPAPMPHVEAPGEKKEPPHRPPHTPDTHK